MITVVYEDKFETNLVPVNALDYPATTGRTLFYNIDGSGQCQKLNNELIFGSNVNTIVCDAESRSGSGRVRTKGRIHYLKFQCQLDVGTTWQQSYLLGTVNNNVAADGWWAYGVPVSGFLIHEGTGTIRTSSYNHGVGLSVGVYQLPSYIEGNVAANNSIVELALYERGNAGGGVIGYVRLDSGPWKIVFLENLSATRGALSSRRGDGENIRAYKQMGTYDTDYQPTPLVQQSFATVIGPSDGTGNSETGGGSVTEIQSGSLAITASKLQMSADGAGLVVFDIGVSDNWIGHVTSTVYNGSPSAVILRYADASNYLYCDLNSTTDAMRLVEVVAGAATVLVTKAFGPGPTDNYDLPDGTTVYWTFRIFNATIHVTFERGALHDNYVTSTTTRFNTSTKCGVMVNKGAGVNSSTASNLIVFATTQDLPIGSSPVDDGVIMMMGNSF